MSSTDERNTLRERIAAAWSHARCSEAHDPTSCSTCALFALLDSPVGEPEPDAWLVEFEDDAGWHKAAVRLTEESVRRVCEPWSYNPRIVPLYRRSKLPGAVISEPGKGWVHVGPVDEGFDSLHDEVEATTVGSVEIDEPIRSPESMAETMEAFVRNEAPHLLPFYQRPPVHNHGPEDGPSVACRETLIGDCVRRELERAVERHQTRADEYKRNLDTAHAQLLHETRKRESEVRRARIEAFREAALDLVAHEPREFAAAAQFLRNRADELEAGGPPA